jgi:hypothetical protein
MKITTSPVGPAAKILAGLLLGYVYREIFPVFAIIFFLFLSGLLFAHSIKHAQWVLHNLAFVFRQSSAPLLVSLPAFPLIDLVVYPALLTFLIGQRRRLTVSDNFRHDSRHR